MGERNIKAMTKEEREQKIEIMVMITGWNRSLFEKWDDEKLQSEYIKALGER
jgi:hypothetical protein